jgi:hypothetical protein
MIIENQKRLEDFVKRAELVQAYSYMKNPESIIGAKSKWVDGKLQVEFFQPEQESTDALLYNMRLFYNNKDDISIRRMAELYDDPEISPNWKNEFAAIRQRLNERFDMVVVKGPEGELKYRDVFEMFLYGSGSHRAEKDKAYKMYQKWVTSDDSQAILYNTFHEAILFLLEAAINIGKASKEELQRARKADSIP